jgi:hypothetical protein
MAIGKRHSQDFVVDVRLEPFDASVSVRLVAIVKPWPPRQQVGGWNA